MNAVLLLHGFATDVNDFKSIIPMLEQHYDFVDSFLFPGHSSNGTTREFTAQKTLNETIYEFDKLKEKYDKIDVIGFSMGGAVATYLSNCRTVNKLILLAPANKYLNLRTIFEYLNFYIKNNNEKFLNKKDEEKYKEIKCKIENVNKNTQISFEMMIKILLPRYTLRNLNVFTKVIKMCNNQLSEIKPPTLIIWGNLDQLVPIESIKYVYSLCSNKNKKIVVLDDISHLMLYSIDISRIENVITKFIEK